MTYQELTQGRDKKVIGSDGSHLYTDTIDPSVTLKIWLAVKEKGMTKAILYDLDGVLVDACEWHYIALNKALNEISGDVISRTEHETIFDGLPTKTKMDLMAKQGRVKREDIDRIYAKKQEFTVETIREEAKTDEGKIRMHEWTKNKGYRTALVSNCSYDTAALMLARTGQAKFIEKLFTNKDYNNPKPHPEPYIRAMIHFGFHPEEYLIVEDSDRGYKAASLTGAKVWRVKNAKEVTLENLEPLLK